jgi:hypothetical protein
MLISLFIYRRTSVQQGIVDIHLTVGSTELQQFTEANGRKMLRKEVPWTRIEKDLSGMDRKQVFLWYLKGEGKEVYTDLQMALAPDPAERVNEHKMLSRYSSMKKAGVTCAGHKDLSFEVRGINARKGGGSSPVLDEIEVSLSREMDGRLLRLNYDKVKPSMDKFGLGNKNMPINVWIHVKRFQLKSKGNDLVKAVLSEFPWWTAGIGSCVDRFALSTDAIAELHSKCFQVLHWVYASDFKNRVWY